MKYYTLDIHKLHSNISGFHASSKTDDEGKTLAFFRELNPLSNFHPAKFSVSNKNYISSEQFIQEQKAVFFQDEEAADQIIMSESLLECKELGRNIKNVKEDVWKRNAKKICYPGIYAKFQQNQHLIDMLKSTGNSHLVEASYNRTWGTGIPLKDQDCLNSDNWYSTGILGEILMEVRWNLGKPTVEDMEVAESTTVPQKDTVPAATPSDND